MVCGHYSCTGRCGLFSRCKEDSLGYDKEGHCTTKDHDECSVDNLNCDEEGYCITGSSEKYPEDSCDSYEK